MRSAGTVRIGLLVSFCVSVAAAAGAQVVVRADVLHTASGPAIENGVVVIEDGKITAVGPLSSVRVPTGLRELQAAVVTPGLIDSRSTLGLSGAYNSNVGPVRDQDQLELSDPIQPELRAIDAYNAREELIAYARRFGVTTIHTGHGPGALVSGQTLIAKTTGRSVEEALIAPRKMLAVTLGDLNQFKKPGTKAKGVAMLRGALLKAQEYAEKQAGGSGGEDGGESEGGRTPARDLGMETLAAALAGEVTLMVRANTSAEIVTALRLHREFGFPMVLDGAAEAYLVLDEIRESGVPVFLHPPRARIANKSFETAKHLLDAGIPFAVQTGHEGYVPKTRVLLFEAAHNAAHGLSFEEALASITRTPAELLGIEERVGTLEVGKDGDVVLYSGDPFEYTTQVCGVVIEGELTDEECH